MGGVKTVLGKYPFLGIVSLSVVFLVCAEQGDLVFALVVSCVLGFMLCVVAGRSLLLLPLFILVVIRYVVLLGADSVHLGAHIGDSYTVQGVVVSQPYTSGHRQRFRLQPELLINDKGRTQLSTGLIQVTTGRYAEIQQGDIVRFYSYLEEPQSDGDFNYKEYLRTIGVFALAESFTIEITEPVTGFESVVVGFRSWVRNTVQSKLPEPHAALLIGMLIGTKEEFYQDFDKVLSVTGTTHVIAVSGFNVTLLIILILSQAGRVDRRALFFIAGIIVVLFLAVVGFDNQPALRATIMGIAVLIGSVSGRRGAVQNSLGIALILMLLINPLSLFSLSLQLSFAATLGLIFLEPRVKRLLPPLLGNTVKEELDLTLSASIATLPVTLGSFGTIPVLSPLANVLVGPLIPLIMLAGVLLLIGSVFGGVVGVATAVPAWIVLELFVQIVSMLAAVEGAVITISENRTLVAALILLGMFISIRFVKPHADS